MPCRSAVLAIGATLAVAGAPQAALAQRAGENATASSDDAFGMQVGTEATGIYNENDTRGLSPLKAGNARLDGIYFDPVASLSGRTRSSYGMRVGIAAIDYPFPAPTGIVDNRLRSAGEKFIGSVALTKLQYDGYLAELDFQVPMIKDTLSTFIGLGHAHTVTGDGAVIPSVAMAIKPVIKTAGGVEVSPFYAATLLFGVHQKPFFLTSGSLVPPQPELGHYLGQEWAKGRNFSSNLGVTLKAPLGRDLSLRAGLFRSGMVRIRNYSEFMIYSGQGSTVQHRLISDPRQELHSWSGEAQLALKLGGGKGMQHRLIGGFRARKRYTESGGSDSRDFGLFDIYGDDPEVEPIFTYGPVNVGRVTQTSWLLGYQARQRRLGSINLGLQRSSYRATFIDGRSGASTSSRDDAWLYNASFALHLFKGLELFGGTQTGLEDSGAAPENALNRNEQLPTTRSTQYEAGLRYRLGKGNQLVFSSFQIKRPYFSFDSAGRYAAMGEARYRGAEFSYVGHYDRLTVLAGAVMMTPEVTGAARNAGLVGERPAGIPDFYTRIDLQYRTDVFDGLTPTVTVIATGPRAMGSAPVASLGGKQAMIGSLTSIDLGLRYRFKLADMPANVRFQVQNVFNQTGWKVVNSNTLQPEEHRRVSVFLAADF